MSKEKLYVAVFESTHELYITPYGGILPPMSIRDLNLYFDCDITKHAPNLENNGYIDKVADGYGQGGIRLYECAPDKECPHCGRPVVASDTDGYAAQCFYCDEDFYNIELIQRGSNDEQRANKKRS